MNERHRTIPASQWHKVLRFDNSTMSANESIGVDNDACTVQRFDETCKWIASIDLNAFRCDNTLLPQTNTTTNSKTVDEYVVDILHHVLTTSRITTNVTGVCNELAEDRALVPDVLDNDLFKMIFSYDCGDLSGASGSGLLFVYECDMEVGNDSSVSHTVQDRNKSPDSSEAVVDNRHMFDTIDIRIENSVVHGSATVTMTVKSVCERARTSSETKISGRHQCAVNLMQFLVAFARGESWCVCCAEPVDTIKQFAQMKKSLRWMHSDIDWRFAQAIAPLVRSYLLGSARVYKFIVSAHEFAQTVAKRLEDAQLAHDQAEVNRSIRALVGLLADDAESNENTLMLPLSMQRTEAHKIIAILSERFYDAKPPDLLRNSDYGNDNIDYTQVQYALVNSSNHSPAHQQHCESQQNTTSTTNLNTPQGCVTSGTVQHI